jgi:hypothetical protein
VLPLPVVSRGSCPLLFSVSGCNTVPPLMPGAACDSHSGIAPVVPLACKRQYALLARLPPHVVAVAKWHTLGTMSSSRVCHWGCCVILVFDPRTVKPVANRYTD